MPDVAILHGWSDTSKSFRPLAAFLAENGYAAVPLWLGDYISMDDDVRIEDVAKRMEAVVAEKIANRELSEPFDLIVHSTGGLVARRWIVEYYAERGRACPCRRLIMLAPANFGSRLASTGKSMIGRVLKGAKNFFQTGTQMLNALELASPFQWNLACRDLLVADGDAPTGAVYGFGAKRVAAFVIVGSHPYGSGVRKIVDENGSDGTVRVAAANLNALGVTVDFSVEGTAPALRFWPVRHGNVKIPLAVLPDRHHSSIVDPAAAGESPVPEISNRLGGLIIDALKCESAADYAQTATAWEGIGEATARFGGNGDESEKSRKAVFPNRRVSEKYFHQYFQIVVRVEDDCGNPVPDYFMEFFGPGREWRPEAVYFHDQVLEHVHNNAQGAENRCFFIDRFDLINNFYGMIPDGEQKILSATIVAAPPGPNVTYFSNSKERAEGSVLIHGLDDKYRWLRRNATHLVKIVVPRVPKDKVFELRRFE